MSACQARKMLFSSERGKLCRHVSSGLASCMTKKGSFFVAFRKLHRNLPCFVNIESIEEIVHHELGARTDKKHARMR